MKLLLHFESLRVLISVVKILVIDLLLIKCMWLHLIHVLRHFIALIHATIIKIFKLSVLRVVFKRHCRVEHFYHFTGFWKIHLLLLLGSWLWNLRNFRLICLDETDLALKDLTWVFKVNHVLISWNFYGRSELLWLNLVVIHNRSWIM